MREYLKDFIIAFVERKLGIRELRRDLAELKRSVARHEKTLNKIDDSGYRSTRYLS